MSDGGGAAVNEFFRSDNALRKIARDLDNSFGRKEESTFPEIAVVSPFRGSFLKHLFLIKLSILRQNPFQTVPPPSNSLVAGGGSDLL